MLPAARVLVIDDSLTMRMLFSAVLEKTREIAVVGMAASADEARALIPELRPNVLTLDVEMPGMNGLDFLAEVMSERPMPVVMLSTLTQKGAATSLRAYELGAVECFPKPMRATPDEFDKIASKLGKLVIAASKSKATTPRRAAVSGQSLPNFVWNGQILGISVSTGGVDALSAVLTAMPKDCPPTVVVLPIDFEMVTALATKLDGSIAPRVVMAADAMPIEQGTVYLAGDPDRHVVIDRWPGGVLRLIDRDPVRGARPSANLLFASMAKSACGVGVIMSGMGEDGAAGLKLLCDAGRPTFAQDEDTSVIHEAAAAAIALGAVGKSVPLNNLTATLLAACSTGNSS